MGKPFWHTLQRPILGLSPMDGITDAPFRAVIAQVGHPTVLYTEFVSAEGLSRGISRLLVPFISDNSTIPLVGQLFGADPKRMYIASLILCFLGFDGIDINMGCPDDHVVKSGSGAALIGNTGKAKELVTSVRSAISDYHNGKTLDEYDFPVKFNTAVKCMGKSKRINRPIGVSIKTRIGYDKEDIHSWIEPLIDIHPDCLSAHGRTATQKYEGKADWEVLHEISKLAKTHGVIFLGNGDIQSHKQALQCSQQYTPDGVLIGRGALGNPWVFSGKIPTFKDRITAALLHLQYFDKLIPKTNPLSLRKHLAWYIKGSENASEIRSHIMTLSDVPSYREYLKNLL